MEFKTVEEEISEKEAQLQYENSKLQDELNHLKDHTLSVEENLNAVYFNLSQKENFIKSLEQQVNLLCQEMKEKEQLVELLEHEKGCIVRWKDKLLSENLSLKEALKKEQLINSQIGTLKAKEEELRNLNAKLKHENSQLLLEVHVKTEELSLNAESLKNSQLQIKELEDEKAELIALKDMLLSREKEERSKSLEPKGCFLKKSSEWSKFSTNFLAHDDQESTSVSCYKDRVNTNLREEILEVEVIEKQSRIMQLEKLLHEKETSEAERNNLISKLKLKLNSLELLKCDWNTNFKIDSTTIYDIYEDLVKLLNWPEGQPNECKPLTDMASLAVVVKNGVQTSQPGPIRIVETISIASQTDPIRNLSPVLFPGTIEILQSEQNDLRADEEEEEDLEFIEDNKGRKVTQLFSEHKNCDLDMDIYRSCRKLSVLPEEDNDESFIRKSSLKNSNFKLKTHSADDVSQFKTVKLIFKESSFSNLIASENGQKAAKQLKECVLKISETSFKNSDSSFKSATDNFMKTDINKNNNNESMLPSLSPKDVFRQPHSFDSYLNPSEVQTGYLTRQVSDPTQNTVFAPPITRRGSYIKRPRSTCRPLTLTCDKEDKKTEERICKVRFDLPHKDKNENEADSAPVLNNNGKTKIISRFRVEVIDEVEFRKSIEQQPANGVVSRKRPPLIHSVVYKQSVLRDITNLNSENEILPNDNLKFKPFVSESPDSPTYDTATEGSPVGSIDIDNSLILDDPLPLKKRKQSDSSCYSAEDSQDNSEGNDIFMNSIKLHSNSECIVMKALSRESSGSSTSNTDQDIPYIDTEDLPVIKPSPEVLKTTILPEILFSEKKPSVVLSPGSASEDSDIYFTPCDVTPVSENESSIISIPKSTSLSKSPTVLKNLANFEILSTITESRKMVSGQISEEDESEEFHDDPRYEEHKEKTSTDKLEKLKRTSSDMSETSESDTLTYGTVKSQLQMSSDGDSDTYVTVWSDKSAGLERKFSDLSENSSSPYNTPPDTSTASFCTPPDTYSPVLGFLREFNVERSGKISLGHSIENRQEEFSDGAYKFNSPVCSKTNSSNLSSFEQIEKLSEKEEFKTGLKSDNIFDSPKLEFYETNDSVENLESFLQSEEGLTDYAFKEVEESRNSANWSEARFFGMEEDMRDAKRNSLESTRLFDRRGKKHPPLSRQNSTEDFNFLDNHDSCLNLSEEVSSPSTTPDTSNKTVILKSIPLTVSNTIDLEDEDFPISEAEIQVDITKSQTNVLEILLKGETPRKIQEDVHYHSEPCTPSISSPADFPEFAVPRKQRSSFNDESLMCGKFDTNLPEIIVSNLSSESDNSDSEIPDLAATDFASNVSERSEVNLSDVKSISGLSENCGSSSEHSDNVATDAFSSDSDKSSAISPEVSQNSSCPLPTDATPPNETSNQDVDENLISENNSDALANDQIQTVLALGSPDCQELPAGRQEINTDVFPEDSTNLTNEKKTPAKSALWMSKMSDTPFSGIEELEENCRADLLESSFISSNNSRDVNLNSKKFADCNLLETLREQNGVEKSLKNSKKGNINSEFQEAETNEAMRKTEKFGSNQNINSHSENSTSSSDARKSSNVVKCSTPVSELPGSQALSTLFSVSSDGSPSENGGQTFVLATNVSNQSSALTNEEIGKRFQDLSFAFKTDSLTIRNRLHLMKRRRDQAEFVIENELKAIKAKLKNLQVMSLNSEYINLMSDLKKQLDFVLNASIQLSSSAEHYGYAQHEESSLDFVTVMLQHVENVETLNNEASKVLEKLKLNSNKFQITQVQEANADCDKLLRRQSMPVSPMGISCRRRASIATLPGISNSILEEGKDGLWTPKRHVAGAAATSSKSIPGSLAEEGRRESNFGRQKLESKESESSLKGLNEFRDQLTSAVNSESLEEDVEDESNNEANESSLHLKQFFDSIEEIRQNSSSQDRVELINYLKKILELNKLVLSATRFRWPENVLQYVPFYITWYVVFILALVFFGGLFTGINGCYIYSCLKLSFLWVATLAFLSLARRFSRFVLLLFLTVVFLTVALLLWLTKVILPRLTDSEVDTVLKTLGLEVRYPYGPPPV